MLCQIKVIAHQRLPRGPKKEPDTHNKSIRKLFKRTPGLNTLGFLFAVMKRFMIETVQDNKQKRQVEFTARHTLSKEQLQKLIEEKFARAREYHLAWKQREVPARCR